ncbi:MAG: HEAT repeat domain-containing protein, partial [Verrucomicrobiota bacterium]
IYEALQDPHPGVRQVACEAIAVTRTWQSVAANQPAEMEIELERNQTISGQLARIVRSDSPPVARSAAMALGRMGEFRAIGALLGRLGRLEQDRFLEHSLIYALIEIDDFESTHEALKSENPSIISGALWALEGMNSSQLEIFDVLPFLDEEDSQLRQTAIAIASQHPGWDAGIANTFFNWVEDLSETRQIALMEMIPQLTMTPPFADFLTSLANSDESGHRELALELITRSTATRLRGDWRSAIRSALKTDVDPTLRSLAIAALARFPESSFLPLLKTLQESDQVGAGERRMLEDLVERLESTPERTRALPIFKEPESP